MGEVRVAYDHQLNREIAVKFLTLDTKGARSRFIAEAQVTAQLEHPNIVPVHDFGETDTGRPYLAMKRVQGRSLFDTVKRGDLSLEQRLDVFRKICDAVAFAHDRGVLHRDLKTENVMVGAFGEVLLMDWGLARPIEGHDGWAADETVHVDRFEAGAFRTREGAVAGTPAYMSMTSIGGSDHNGQWFRGEGKGRIRPTHLLRASTALRHVPGGGQSARHRPSNSPSTPSPGPRPPAP